MYQGRAWLHRQFSDVLAHPRELGHVRLDLRVDGLQRDLHGAGVDGTYVLLKSVDLHGQAAQLRETRCFVCRAAAM
jgi:hypothetical protein